MNILERFFPKPDINDPYYFFKPEDKNQLDYKRLNSCVNNVKNVNDFDKPAFARVSAAFTISRVKGHYDLNPSIHFGLNDYYTGSYLDDFIEDPIIINVNQKLLNNDDYIRSIRQEVLQAPPKKFVLLKSENGTFSFYKEKKTNIAILNFNLVLSDLFYCCFAEELMDIDDIQLHDYDLEPHTGVIVDPFTSISINDKKYYILEKEANLFKATDLFKENKSNDQLSFFKNNASILLSDPPSSDFNVIDNKYFLKNEVCVVKPIGYFVYQNQFLRESQENDRECTYVLINDKVHHLKTSIELGITFGVTSHYQSENLMV